MITDITSQLLRDEGLRLFPYTDTVGKLTIGVGRNLSDNGISSDEAMSLLKNDLDETNQYLINALPWFVGLSPARQGVLQNMAFNMGLHGLMQFRQFLGAVQNGQYDDAARFMLESKWATQVPARAHRLSIQMGTDQWQ